MPFTGVLAQLRPEGTLNAALHLLPNTKHVVVVGGVGKFDEGWEAIAKQSFHNYESKLEFTYLFDLTMPALLERLKHLPRDTIVYHTSISQDAAGDRFIDSAQSIPMVASAANAPVFVMDDVDLRAGTVGGDLVNWADDARIAAEIATQVLNGEKPQDIPVVTSNHAYMFDWRALKRWGLKESNLPPGSIVLNRQLTVWESFKWYIVSGIALILLEALLIGGLVWQRARRRKVETDLAVTYDRLRLAVEAGKSVGWDWDIKSGRDQWFGDLRTMFGIPADNYSGHVEDFRRSIHPEDRELVWKAVADARQSRKPYIAEFRVVRADGTVRWIAAKGKFYYAPNGDPQRMLGMAVDITDRKLAEAAVRESEERFRLVANNAPVMIWMSGLDKKPTYFNQLWLDFTGLSETDLLNGLAGIVHPEDYSEGLDMYRRGFDQRQPFRKQCRLRRHDGQYRWMLDIGVPRFHKDGSFAGYIGSCTDVTDHKLAEEVLSDIARKLVAAQEKERTRIARELHDDISQRLAMLAVELEQVQNDPSEIQQRVSELRKQTTEISNGVQALSHDLHSSQLEYLGAVAAMKNWCKEFGDRLGMQIDYRQDVRSTLAQEIGLCLFRVLQEALHNAVKHSGVKRIEVQLHEESAEIHLTIRDLGKGFDVEAAKKGQGLGLTSMQERVRAVNGKIAIESKPMGGTTIHVRVPFSSEKFSARAVG
jgi:PAS domain S-box-containing protein